MINGHCECNRISFEVDGVIEDFSHCHCSQCRRMHGAAFATFGGVAKTAFTLLSGENELTRYTSSATHERTFWRLCRSNIYVALDSEPETLYLSMGAVDGDPPRPPGYHIFVSSKAPWHEITDDLDQYAEEPPD